MMLFEVYRKEGIFRFVAIRGIIGASLFLEISALMNSWHSPFGESWLILIPIYLIASWLFTFGLWFWVMWYFAKVKKKLVMSRKANNYSEMVLI